MSLFSDIGDAIGSAAKTIANVAGDAVDVVGSVAKDTAESTVNGLEHTFDDGFSVLKAAAFATVLSPVSLAIGAYDLGDAIYTETDKKVKERE